jgi:hypothetical protein
MPTTPAGSMSLTEATLAASLAACASVRTWMVVADAAAAAEKIHLEGLPLPASAEQGYSREELEALRPYIVIFTAEKMGFTYEQNAVSEHLEYTRRGRLVVRLVQNAPEGYDDEPTSAANLMWRNTIGTICDELCTLSGQAGYLAFRRLAVTDGPYWSHPTAVPAQGMWQGVDLEIEWEGV